jgi:hypothetical protein
MKTLKRKAGLLAAALVLAAVLVLVMGSPRQAKAGCGSDVTTTISSQLDISQTSDTQNGRTVHTQDVSNRSEHHSDNGQDLSLTQTSHTNADGSSHSHQEIHSTDSEGKGCYSNGIPQKGDNSGDDDTDSEGNRKQHYEDIIEKNGKCEKIVTDKEWNSKGKLIKNVVTKSEIPCSEYILEVDLKGSVSDSGSTLTYGPNKYKIYLEKKDAGLYTGKTESVYDFKLTGKCESFGAPPIAFDVTAKEDELRDLEFFVKSDITMLMAGKCHTAKGALPRQQFSGEMLPFTLPEVDGASYKKSMPMAGGGDLTITFTLREKQ